MNKNKIIIHIDGDINVEEAVSMVLEAIKRGKISASGKSYCYGIVFDKKFLVSTGPPRKGTSTNVFYVTTNK